MGGEKDGASGFSEFSLARCSPCLSELCLFGYRALSSLWSCVRLVLVNCACLDNGWENGWVYPGALSFLRRDVHLVLVNCVCLDIGWGRFEFPCALCSPCLVNCACMGNEWGKRLVHLGALVSFWRGFHLVLVNCACFNIGLGRDWGILELWVPFGSLFNL